MASTDVTGKGDGKLLVAIYHPLAARAEGLRDAIEATGSIAQILPPPVNGLRHWVDSCFDLLLINPFLDWQEPFEFVRLARSIAGRRPLIVVSDRDSLGDRMVALGAGADDAVGWGAICPKCSRGSPACCAAAASPPGSWARASCAST